MIWISEFAADMIMSLSIRDLGSSCGPLHLRATGNKSGTVQLSSAGKTFRTNLKDNMLRCTAIVNGPDGSDVARTSLLRTRDCKYVGIWNANIPPGVYKVSINASANGLTKVFCRYPEDRGNRLGQWL